MMYVADVYTIIPANKSLFNGDPGSPLRCGRDDKKGRRCGRDDAKGLRPGWRERAAAGMTRKGCGRDNKQNGMGRDGFRWERPSGRDFSASAGMHCS